MADRSPADIEHHPPSTSLAARDQSAEAAADSLGARRPALGTSSAVTVEVFGVPRLLLRAARTEAAGATLGALAADLAVRCPALVGPVLDPGSGWLRPGYTFVLDGRFTRDPAAPVGPESEVLLVSSVAGGAK
jgi:hypothetical protein